MSDFDDLDPQALSDDDEPRDAEYWLVRINRNRVLWQALAEKLVDDAEWQAFKDALKKRSDDAYAQSKNAEPGAGKVYAAMMLMSVRLSMERRLLKARAGKGES